MIKVCFVDLFFYFFGFDTKMAIIYYFDFGVRFDCASLFPLMLMLVDDNLISFDVDPQSAGVAPTHAVESMKAIADANFPRGFDAFAVSVHV